MIYRLTALNAALISLATGLGSPVFAEDDFAPKIPPIEMYQQMLGTGTDGRDSGWAVITDVNGQQLVHFSHLQTLHCRLSEIRYSINSEALDERFPVADCVPSLPWSLQDGDKINITLPAGTVKTIAVQAVWEDGSASKIVVYKPCEGVGERTCSQPVKVLEPDANAEAPAAGSDAR